MRNKIAAGNWKMNTNYEEGVLLAENIVKSQLSNETQVILACPFIHLKGVYNVIQDSKNVFLAAQNMSNQAKGAYTGEISADMLLSVGCTHVLIGHSERRAYYGEDSEILNQKLKLALESGLTPIFCCGEPLGIRKQQTHVEYVSQQLEETVFNLEPDEFKKLVIAYEPIWAIGTGETASPEQAQEMHAAIRGLVNEKFGQDLSQSVSILYGGSVKPTNAKELFANADVDGGLVGGASLDANGFVEIINAF